MNKSNMFLALLVFAPMLLAQTDVVLPWVSNNDNFVSKIVINNLEPNEAQVVMVGTRNDGSEQAREITIAGYGQYVADAGSLFETLGKGAGYRVFITSDNSMDAAQVVSGTATESGSSPAQSDSLDPTDAAPILRFNYMPIGNGFSAPVVVNMGDGDATVKFHAYQNGVLAATSADVNLASGRPYAAVTADLFPDMTGDFFVVAEADQPLLGSAFLFNAQREPSMANAKAMSELPVAPSSFNNITVYPGYVAVGINHNINGPVRDFGGMIGIPGFPTVGAYNENGTSPIPLTPDMLLDPESVILAAGTVEGIENENVPLQDIPVIVNALGITLTRAAVPGVQDADQVGIGLAMPNGPITLDQWLKAEGTMTVICNNDGTSDITIAVKNMIPNRIYTIWHTIGDTAGSTGPFGGLPNAMTTDENGNGHFKRTVTYCPNNIQDDESPLVAIEVVLHSDQMVNGALPTTKPISSDVHVQLEFFGSGTPIQP